MNRKHTLIVISVLVVLIAASETFAQRGRGGGGRGGGGRSYGGGGGMGSMSRPAPSYRPSPSMSRPAAQSYRPSPSANRSPSMSRPAMNRPSTSSLQGGGANRQSANTRSSTQFAQKPSRQNLDSFLNMPEKPRASSFSSADSPPSASQLPAGNNSGKKTFTTEGGSTITVGGAGGSGVTGSGATVGGAVGGIKVETAGGETFGRVSGVGGATDGTNSAVRGGSVTGATDGQGNSAANVRGGYADSSGYRQGGSVTGTRNASGVTRVAGTAGYGYGNGTGHIGSAYGVRGPGGNTISAGHGASYVNGQFVGGQSWSAVNGSYTHWNAYGPGWANQYPNAWWPGKWAVATTAWATATYAVAGGYCGCPPEPTYYDYGENVTYDDGTVYQDDQPVATAEEYYDQADQIAESGTEASNEDWMPLGVFALVSDGQTNADKTVQLALNKDGVIRGNYNDLLANTLTPVTGAVDRVNQRVALKLEGNDQLIVETGLYNLTNDEVPILIHFSPDRQETKKLIRLEHPDDAPPST